ncbi:alpha/beta hydrolase [Bradyrhizobium sp. CCGUVB1N3]|uniref:alpha/beta hydrolase family protein n=1 Tax=Bradyrhizobium sp. CCGUVB1N3 TaxID=2949629 RepID=UPI0020B1CB5B|nr:alpha/beta hydrolase [Bradyrhizobium sp. CCGUVB1N3]MCP3477283.1 alpha/beta hydrolase [Bradyrhizobium sp. CCGUVB1N3]
MDGDLWLRASLSDASAGLARVRNSAAAFLEEFSASASKEKKEHWILNWMTAGDRHRASAELAAKDNLPDRASEFWLCALTAFEVARQLACPENSSGAVLADRIEGSLRSFESCAPDRVERVEIELFEGVLLAGYFLPAARSEQPAPAVIFVSDEESPAESIVSRLLPAVNDRNLSVLVVSGDDASKHRLFKPEAFLASWLNYLECRSDVDAGRIAVSGERTAAGYAARIAASDRRIVAAVCDGGLWASLRHRASVGWMTGIWDTAGDRTRTSSLQLVRRMRCPVLIVAGSRALFDQQSALELQADCKLAGLDCSVAVHQASGELENFVTKDDLVLDWLERKLRSRG